MAVVAVVLGVLLGIVVGILIGWGTFPIWLATNPHLVEQCNEFINDMNNM